MHIFQRWIFGLVLVTTILTLGCTKKIYSNRNQFVKNKAPTVDINQYRSVQERPNQNPKVAIAMAISGGGSRAYNFAMGVMLELDEIQVGNQRSLLNEVDYFSTVSGGGFAAGAYMAALYDHQKYSPELPFRLKSYYDDRIRNTFRRNFTTPLVTSWLNPITWFSYLDDGDALEKSIDYNVLSFKERRRKYGRNKTESIKLGDLFIDKNDTLRSVTMPMMVANGTIYNSMAIFPFAPNVIDTFQISGYTHHFKKNKSKQNIDPYSLPLSVGIKASGSFPVAISNSTLLSNYHPEFKYLHIIDGGVADNIGYITAIEMLRKDRIADTKVLLVVDADGGGIVPTFSRKQGGAMALNVYSKLPASGLDSRHNLFREELVDRCRQYGITPIFISFGSLIENNDELPDPVILIEKEQQKLIAQLKLAPQIISKKNLQILYELVSNVQTKYTITSLEQQILNLTGKKVVMMKSKKIFKAIGIN